MGVLWQPYSGTSPKIFKEPTEFLVCEIFLDEVAHRRGFVAFDQIFGIMGACRIHRFYVITRNPELAKQYCYLRGGCYGMRDLGRNIWGQMYLEGPPPDIVPDWCLEWPLKNVEILSIVEKEKDK